MASEASEKHKAYDVKFKLKAVEVARKKNISAAAREFKVDRKRVRQWMTQLVKCTKSGKSKSKRLQGG